MSFCLASYPCFNWLCCTNCSPHCMSVSLSDDHLLDMSLCLASPPVSTDCAALIVLLTVCLYHCRTTISGHELVLGILPCLSWLCCTNCSPHCVSVSLSDDNGHLYHCSPHWSDNSTISGHVLVLGISPCLNWLCCTNCSPHCVSVSLSDDHFWTWACAWHLTLFELTVLH